MQVFEIGWSFTEYCAQLQTISGNGFHTVAKKMTFADRDVAQVKRQEIIAAFTLLGFEHPEAKTYLNAVEVVK